MIGSKKTFRLSGNQVSSNLSGSTVILNHKDGFYYELNEVGTFVWEQLKAQELTADELKKNILFEFEIDEATAESDLNKLLSDLSNEKLVETV